MARPMAERDDDERGDQPRRKKKKQGSAAWLWILLGCGGIAAIGCIVGAGVIAVFVGTRASTPTAQPNQKIKQMAGLLAYWSFEDVQGNKVTDHSGRNNHLTLVGARAEKGGLRGNALMLDGQPNQYAEMPAGNDFNFAPNAPFTFAGWFKTPMNSACILSLTSANGPQQIDMLVRNNRFIVVVGDDGDAKAQNAFVWSNVQNDGEWHHFVITRLGNVIALWMDGAPQGQMGAAKSGGPVTTELRALGSERVWIVKNDNRWGNPTFQGAIDEVCVFNRAIDPAEVQVLFEH
jgi:Concanavalin A-like lectin/glucanases superfamily